MLPVSKLRVGETSNNRGCCKLDFRVQHSLLTNRDWSKLPAHTRLAARRIMPDDSTLFSRSCDAAQCGRRVIRNSEDSLTGQLPFPITAAVSSTIAHMAWQWLVAAASLVLSVLAAGHAVLYKRDSRSAIAWVGFIWLVPIIGSVLYFLFAINRVRRRASVLRSSFERYRAQPSQPECSPEDLHHHLPKHTGHLQMLARVVDRVVERTALLPGNRIEPLINGDEAYPAMLEAIAQARTSVSLLTYIFDRDEVGIAFAHALGQATRRGVEVRVLIDAAGTRYSWPPILHALRREGVRYARFLPLYRLGRLLAMNLRTHRKILVCDGKLGFTGGLNIRAGNCLKANPQSPVQDLHFRVEGPVVMQMQQAFADDWMLAPGNRFAATNGSRLWNRLARCSLAASSMVRTKTSRSYAGPCWERYRLPAIRSKSLRRTFCQTGLSLPL